MKKYKIKSNKRGGYPIWEVWQSQGDSWLLFDLWNRKEEKHKGITKDEFIIILKEKNKIEII